eukprot:CAMPEP_0172601516 /NCGR_PEP_ID=MMETSP1068-20121228/21677_1 /TAXON_ID=35684 /ORGANISM="Pseudopedinella elastica, Strain CCMP716" /LENGTH=55 /DNA_ID=CAMNT_0013402527 /DNA_START=73 /DNA_END=240 /DNA_ORIENTATION=-
MTSMPDFTPLLRAELRRCFLKSSPLLLAAMYLVIAGIEEPVRSLIALIAAIAISR